MQKMSFPQLGGYGLASVGGAPSALPAAAAPPHPPHPPPSSQLLMASTSTSTSPTSSTSASGKPPGGLGEPPSASGQTLLDYPAGLLAAYPRMAGLTSAAAEATAAGVYGSYAAAAAAQSYLPTLSTDPSVLYGSLANSPYDLKDSAEAWRNLQAQTAAYYSYDPTMMAYPYNGYGFDFNAARRKNATKENTGTLKAWLNEHRKNPYPTKGEKIMLAIITKMTLTQVSTWFANARRRLKKENKMTWTPKNGSRDSDDDDDDDEDKCDGDRNADSTGAPDNNNSPNKSGESHDVDVDGDVDVESVRDSNPALAPPPPHKHEELLSDGEEEIDAGSVSDLDPSHERHGGVGGSGHPERQRLTSPPSSSGSPPPCAPIPFRPPGGPPSAHVLTGGAHRPSPPSTSASASSSGGGDASVKPRIWSLADVVASSNPHSRLSPPGNAAASLPHSAFGTPTGLRPQSHPHHSVGPIPGSPLRPWVHQGSSPYSIHGTSATQTLAGFAPHPYGLAAVRAAASVAGHLPPGSVVSSSPHSVMPAGSPAIPSLSRLPVNVPAPLLPHHRDGQRMLNGLMSRSVNEKSSSNQTSSPGSTHDSRTAFTPVVKRNLNEPLKV